MEKRERQTYRVESIMSEKRFSWKTEKLQHLDDEVLLVVDNENKEWEGHILNIVDLLNELSDEKGQLKDENEKLHHELQQIKEYLQTKIDECKNHKKMKEIVFGVEQAVGYEKALLSFQKGLKRRLNDE